MKPFKNQKLDEEQLSLVLGAHAAGNLCRYGMNQRPNDGVCLLQAAWGVQTEMAGVFAIAGDRYDWEVTRWFDSSYYCDWTIEEFLAQLEEAGIA